MCLNSVLRELDSLPLEVIVVDDASTDGTAGYLESCSGIRVIRHPQKQGLAQSVNDGAVAASGRYLHILDHDTLVTPGWMPPLLHTFEMRDRVGAVCSQLRSRDGKVSEAGAVIWRDGQGMRYGVGRQPTDAGVAFPREVDYGSVASVMIRAEVFHALGGFAGDFTGAHYEGADLCLRIRDNGYRVAYQPDSVVLHFDSDSTPDAASAEGAQDEMHRRFVAKWQPHLAKHYPPDEYLLERAARRIAGARTVLVMDSFVPFSDRSAGARRAFEIMRLMRDLDWHVIFVADDGGDYEPYTSRLRRAGVEVLPHRSDGEYVLRHLPVPIDVAWVARPDVLQKYLPVLRGATAASIVYDTVDLHFLRAQREEAVTGHVTHWEAMREIELDFARKVDRTVVTSAAEREILASRGIEAGVVPIIETPVQTRAAYAARNDILFLGNYTHAPNADAAHWLATEIMPAIWERMPSVRLILAGADPTPAVQRLASERVVITGYVHNTRLLFDEARVFAAAIRFGAGMKGKTVQSLAHGLPVVTTDIGAEGISLVDGENALLCNDAAAFAQAVMRLYNTEALWARISGGGLRLAQDFSPQAIKPMLNAELELALERKVVDVGVDLGLSTHSA
jgi:GT2 family glycosyltransferase